MHVQDVCQVVEGRRVRKRVGRGIGTGSGKTSGRGHKGAGSRSGHRRRLAFEGGQSPVFRRVAKKGQSRRHGSTVCQLLTVSDLLQHFVDGDYVDTATLVRKSLVARDSHPYKILAFGPVGIALTLRVRAISRAATRQIQAVGGNVELE